MKRAKETKRRGRGASLNKNSLKNERKSDLIGNENISNTVEATTIVEVSVCVQKRIAEENQYHMIEK